MLPHGLEEVQGADEVVGIVLQGLGDALAHGLEPGEVDDGINAGILGKEGLHLLLVAQLRFDEGDFLSHDLLHPAKGLLAGVVEVVRHDDVAARLDKLHAGMAADIARAAADKNGHRNRSFQIIKIDRLGEIFSRFIWPYCRPLGWKWKERIVLIIRNIVRILNLLY